MCLRPLVYFTLLLTSQHIHFKSRHSLHNMEAILAHSVSEQPLTRKVGFKSLAGLLGIYLLTKTQSPFH